MSIFGQNFDFWSKFRFFAQDNFLQGFNTEQGYFRTVSKPFSHPKLLNKNNLTISSIFCIADYAVLKTFF